MAFRILIPIIAAAVYLILLLIILFQRPLKKLHVLFMVYLLAAALWSCSDAFLRSNLLTDYNIIIFRIVVCSSLWWVVQLYYFSRAFLNLSGGIGIIFGYFSLAILTILAISGYAPPSITYEEGHISPEYGLWFLFYLIPLIVIAFTGVYSLVQKLRTVTSPKAHNKVAYLILAISLLVLFGFSGVTPLAHEFPISHLGGLLSAIVLSNAIIVHELVNVRSILRNALRLATLGIMGLGAYLLIFSLIHLITGIEIQPATLIIAGLSVLIIVVPIYLLRRLYISIIDQLLYRRRYKYRQELLNFIRQGMSGVSNLQELAEGILPPLVKVLRCQQAYILLPQLDNFTVTFTEPPTSNDSILSINKNSPIITWLKSQYLTREDIDVRAEFRGLWEKERDYIENSGIELFFPLLNRGNLIGILALGPKESGRYSLDDTNMVESISNQFAISLEKEYLQEELKKREQELAIINKLSFVMNSSLNIQDVYEVFVDGLKEVIDVDFASIVLIENHQFHISTLSSDVGYVWKVGDRYDLKDTSIEWITKHKKSLVELNLKQNSMFKTDKNFIERDINSIIYLPLFALKEIIGCLIIASRRPDAYNEGKIRLLERLAPQISISIANSLLYTKSEERARVDELTGLFNRRHFDENLKSEILRHSRYGNLFCLVFLDLDKFKAYNDTLGHMAGDRLLSRVGHLIKHSIRNIDIPFRYGGDELAIIMPHTSPDAGQAVIERIRDILLKDMKMESIPVTVSYGLACWPGDGLTEDNIVNAADQALYHSKRTGGNRICQVADIMPTSFATPQQKVSSNEKETLSIIYALAATIEARDPYTYGHSQKVRRYAVALAENIGLPAGKVAIVSHAALLHDIGKIGIYDEILNKADELSADEQKVIKSHPQLSRTIIQHIPSLTPCLPAILHHHERWDGNGYPEGLKGESIPIEARILTIADSFDAMISKRPYREPLSYEESTIELRRCAGSQFDPYLIEKFISITATFNFEELKIN